MSARIAQRARVRTVDELAMDALAMLIVSSPIPGIADRNDIGSVPGLTSMVSRIQSASARAGFGERNRLRMRRR